MGEKKTFVLDTNVLLLRPEAAYLLSGNLPPREETESSASFIPPLLDHQPTQGEPNDIVISSLVIKEMDNLNHNPGKQHLMGSISYATTILDDIVTADGFTYENGVGTAQLPNGALVHFVEHDERKFLEQHGSAYSPDIDDRLIAMTKKWASEHPQSPLIFVSEDNNAKLRAKIQGIKTQRLLAEVVRDTRQQYKGWLSLELTPEQRVCFQSSAVPRSQVEDFFEGITLHPNQYVELQVPGHDPEFKVLRQTKEGEQFTDLTFYHGFMEFVNKARLRRIDTALYRALGESMKTSIEDSLTKKRSEKGRKRKQTQKSLPSVEIIKDRLESLSPESEEFHTLMSQLSGDPRFKSVQGIAVPSLKLNTEIQPSHFQVPYIDMLCNTHLPIVSVIGSAGTGKTYWALMSALYLYSIGVVDRIRYIKPLIGMDEGLGFYKGDFEEKVARWIAPAEDALREILGYYDRSKNSTRKDIELFMTMKTDLGIVEYDIATHAAGRTYRREMVLIDEAHLFRRAQIGMFVGRIGRDTKMVFMGDLTQIKAAYLKGNFFLDDKSSGLAHLVDRLKGEYLFGHLTLPNESVMRSEAAQLAAKLF